MNFNEQHRYQRGDIGRKLIKRPTETPGLDSNPSFQQSYPGMNNSPYPTSVYPDSTFQNVSQPFNPGFIPNTQPNQFNVPQANMGFNIGSNCNILNDPLVTNMAMQYGQVFVGSGRELVNKELNKYVPISKMKYYFAVDTGYVSKKLSIILFPYVHSDWSIKYDQNEPIQPKFEVNAPDLYIPIMAFLTYILVAGIILGTKNEFTPEKLGIEATHAVAWTIVEVLVQLVTLYIANISTHLKTFDLVSYSSYKYVGIIISILMSLVLGHVGYIASLIYVSLAISFFLMRTLKLQVLTEPGPSHPDIYGVPQQSFHQIGLKRRHYFLLFVAFTQPIFMWWFTWRLL